MVEGGRDPLARRGGIATVRRPVRELALDQRKLAELLVAMGARKHLHEQVPTLLERRCFLRAVA